MLSGCREFWERHAAHGIEPGLETGLPAVRVARPRERGAPRGPRGPDGRVVALGGEGRASCATRCWRTRVYALHDARGFIKRRLLDGAVQESIVAQTPDAGCRPASRSPPTALTCSIRTRAAFCRSCSALVDAARARRRGRRSTGRARSGTRRGQRRLRPLPRQLGARLARRMAVRLDLRRAGAGRGGRLGARVARSCAGSATTDGSASGAWFEFNGPRLAPPFPQVGIIPWTWAELILLFVHHVLGVRPGADGIRVRPRLLPGMRGVDARIPVRDGWLSLELARRPRGAG